MKTPTIDRRKCVTGSFAAGRSFFIRRDSLTPVSRGGEEAFPGCNEVHNMRGIRLYPNFHAYRLDRPEFVRLLELATRRGLLVQIVIEMEDERVHHPIVTVPPVDAGPLAAILKDLPQAKVQLLNGARALQRGGAAV